MNQLHASYVNLIADFDQTIGIVRDLWLKARNHSEKAKTAQRLNDLLDERLRLEAARDEAKEAA
jgi:hypothetical protein